MQRILSLISQNTFLQNSLILFVGTMIVNVLNYAFHLIIGRLVDPQAYGEIESLISLLAIISVPAATLTLIATKFAAEMRAKSDTEGLRSLSRYLNRKVLRYGIPLFGLLLVSTPLVKQFLRIPETLPILFLWVVVLLSFLSAVTSGLLTGWQKFVSTNISGVIATVIKVGAAFFLVRLGFAVNGVMGSYVLFFLVSYGMLFWFLHSLFERHGRSSLPEAEISFASVKSYILPAFYGTLSMAILGNADMILAKHHLEGAASGEYGALYVVGRTIFFVTGVLTTVLFAMSSEEKARKVTASNTFHLAVGLTILVGLGGTAAFALFPEFVLGLFFGEKYIGIAPLLVWFALSAGIYSLGNLLMQYLLSLHETRAASFFLGLALLEIPILFFFGGGFYAIIGITLAFQFLSVLLGFGFILRKNHHVEAHLNRDTNL